MGKQRKPEHADVRLTGRKTELRQTILKLSYDV